MLRRGNPDPQPRFACRERSALLPVLQHRPLLSGQPLWPLPASSRYRVDDRRQEVARVSWKSAKRSDHRRGAGFGRIQELHVGQVARHPSRPAEGPKENYPASVGSTGSTGPSSGQAVFDPATLCRENTHVTPVNDPEYKPETYYYTDAISDNAVSFLKEHAKSDGDKPFFLYLAYTTAHWPMHALPEDIEKYKGKYDEGFDPIRKARLKKLKTMGLVSSDTKLSPGSDDWERTPHKEWEIRNMEVYAAMVDNMDQGIGRVMKEVKRQGRFEDTLFLYLQDNGGCAEGYGRYTPKNGYREYEPMGPNDLQKKIWPPMQTRDERPLLYGWARWPVRRIPSSVTVVDSQRVEHPLSRVQALCP